MDCAPSVHQTTDTGNQAPTGATCPFTPEDGWNGDNCPFGQTKCEHGDYLVHSPFVNLEAGVKIARLYCEHCKSDCRVVPFENGEETAPGPRCECAACKELRNRC
ncbi:hypothetical protein M407DRAFT_25361 [Tulasnella calospora MUT 4182]|uniref:Uncharacterized protein n=1 Tax=Tulasnella calospora MUT 4182 TaxID=1051891 RepID=A0A0C3QHT1_9AGAM|nr:hypothetical protein M407DRAFT_25361 [Tulasnella calospora MUT 4182]